MFYVKAISEISSDAVAADGTGFKTQSVLVSNDFERRTGKA
jgi:hypothetical protein